MSVLLGDGHGAFSPQVYSSGGRGPNSVRVEDYNGDGRPDIAVGNDGGNIGLTWFNGSAREGGDTVQLDGSLQLRPRPWQHAGLCVGPRW